MGKSFNTGLLTNGIAQDLSNNIGIGGAANASYKLAVTGTGNFTGALRTSSTFTSGDTIQLGLASTDGGFWTWGSTISYLVAGTGKALNLNPNGATGTTGLSIATTGAATFSSSVTATQGKFSGSRPQGIFTENGTSGLYLRDATGSSYKSWSIGTNDIVVGFAITPSTAAGGTTFSTPSFVINESGNVGIGTSSPNLTSVNRTTVDINGPIQSLLSFSSGGTALSYIFNDGYNFTLNTGSGYMNFQVNGSERMRIASGGQVQFRSYIDFLNGSTSKFIISRAQEILGGSSDDMTLFTQAGLAMQFWTAGGKRMNISSGGYINLNDVVYGNTVNTSPRTLYIENGTGALGGISSIRASKKNIENISNVDWLYQLNPVTFNYRKKDDEGNYTEEIHDYINYGLIAEDTAPIIDFIINYNEKEDGTKEMAGIEYPRLIIPLLKAIQEMNTKINEQNQTIQNLQEQINILAK